MTAFDSQPKRVALAVLGSLIIYYVPLFYLFFTTNSFANCAASALWKYTVLASSASWLTFVYFCLGWRNRSSSTLHWLVLASVTLVLSNCVAFTTVFVPRLILGLFAETYDIVYFDSIVFSFPSAMIALLTATSGIASFNVGLVFRGHDPLVIKRSLPEQFKIGWYPALRNLSLYVGFSSSIQLLFGRPNQLTAFGTLLIVAMIIPILHPGFERLPKHVKWILSLLGISSLMSIHDILDFLTTFSPVHPFTLFALFSSVTVCLSSALGELGSSYIDRRSLRRARGRGKVAIAALLFMLGVIATWLFSHAAIAIILGLSI